MKYEVQKQIRAQNRKRDMSIFRYAIAGELAYHEIGAKFGISGQRVGQIVRRIKQEHRKQKR